MSHTILVALQTDPDPFQFINNFLSSPVLRITGQVLVLLAVVFWLALVYWTYSDAARRETVPFVWGIVAVVLPFFGTLIYLIVRPPEYALDSRERELELAVLERELRSRVLLCPNCRSLVERDYLLCPQCGWDLKKSCVHCERALDLNWDLCPYCETDQRTGKRAR
ncbi:MAG: double zinc ribbon domain-containing protein [Rubrobacteraceae bacterium]|nr:zinc ribbon domain-containing protein [Rubrobacter sp.]